MTQIPLGSRGEILFIEHARLHVRDGVVVREQSESGKFRSYNVPIANTSLILLGTGTSLSVDAAYLLAKANLLVAFTGGGGTPLLSGLEFLPLSPVSEYGPTEYMQTWGRRFLDDNQRLLAAKELLRTRTRLTAEFWKRSPHADGLDRQLRSHDFLHEIDAAPDTTHLLAAEGRHAKLVYKAVARTFEISDFTREPGAARDKTNSFLDHFNYLLYGAAAVALHGLGISSAFSALHGKTRRGGLVFDIADLVKDALSVPYAFHLAANLADDSKARGVFINAMHEEAVIPLLFRETKRILCERC